MPSNRMTRRFLHRSGCYSISQSAGFHVEGFAGPPGLLEAGSFANDARGVFLDFEAMRLHTSVFQPSDHAVDYPVRLRKSLRA
jgi:hypothetical protein